MTRPDPVHPTGIVDPSAKLAPDVVVGPYSIVGPDVVIGEGSVLGPHVVIGARTTLGRRNRDLEYDGVNDDNVRFLIDGLLQQLVKLLHFGFDLGDVTEFDFNGGAEAVAAVLGQTELFRIIGTEFDGHGV